MGFALAVDAQLEGALRARNGTATFEELQMIENSAQWEGALPMTNPLLSSRFDP